MHLNFQRFGDDLLEGLSSEGPADAERSLLVEEVTREVVRRAEQARWALQVQRTSHPRSSTVDFARRIAQSFDSLEP